MSTIRISIIIVLYQSEQVIFECLKSIFERLDIGANEIEIILVDNYELSHFDELLSTIENNSKIPLHYIKNSVNGGFGQGNNVGVSSAKGEFLFFLNPDTILTESFSFKKLLKKIESDSNLVIGFKLVDLNGKENNSYSIFPEYSVFSFLFKWMRKSVFFLPNSIMFLSKLIWPWGAAFVINKRQFDIAGRFDEFFFLCNEEPDLMKRMPKRKVFLLDMNIIHLEGHTTSSSSGRYREYLDSTLRYITKYNLNRTFFLKSVIIREKIKEQFFRNGTATERIKIIREFL